MITSSTALAFLFYCFIQGITPGPANVVSFGTSMAFGTRSAIRQWAGLVVGYLIISAVSLVLLLALGSISLSIRSGHLAKRIKHHYPRQRFLADLRYS